MDGSRIRTTGCLVLLGALTAFATPGRAYALVDPVNSEWHSTARALAMGNAGIATAEDPDTAMFYNPAALASNRRFEFSVFNPQFEFSTSNFTLGGAKDMTDLGSLDTTVPHLRENRGTPAQFGFSLYPNVSAKNFALGILVSAESGSVMKKNGDLIIRSQYLIIPTIGLTVGMLSGIIKIGAALRIINLTTNNKVVPVAQQGVQGYRRDAEEGFGLGVDVGTLIQLPWASLPTFGAVARNIGDTSLSKGAFYPYATGTAVGANRVPMMIDGAFAIQPKLGQTTVLKFAMEFRDTQDKSHVATARKVNVGFELGFNKRLFLRMGGSQGYWSAGFGLSGKSASLDITTYGEELDPTKFQEIEDRRVAISYGGRF